MFKTVYVLIIYVNIVVIHADQRPIGKGTDMGCGHSGRNSTKIPHPIILFNSAANGISYDFISDDNNQPMIISENATKLVLPHYWVQTLDIDIADNYFVWSTRWSSYAIYMSEFAIKMDDQNGTRFLIHVYKRTVMIGKCSAETDVAIDWVHNLIYYFNENNLFVMDVRHPEVPYALTSNRSTDYKTGNIAVNPYESFVVWTEYQVWEGRAVIYRCSEDGSDPKILVYKEIKLPVCLAIDFATKTIVWIDNELHSLSSIDYMGNNRKTLKISKQHFGDCSAMDVFNGSVYWVSNSEKKIMRLSLKGDTTANAVQTVVTTTEIYDNFIKIMSADKQQMGRNYCENNTCAHQCVPNGNRGHRCLCSDTDQLNPCTEPKLQISWPTVPDESQNTSAIAALLATGESLLLFAGRKRDLRLARLSATANLPMYYMESEFMYKTDQYITAVDYSLSGNFLVGIKSGLSDRSSHARYIVGAPVLGSAPNAMNVNTSVTTLVNTTGMTVAVDWVHSLAYYPVCDKPPDCTRDTGINVVNLSAPVNQTSPVLPINTGYAIQDIRVDPHESFIFWTDFNRKTFETGLGYERYTGVQCQIWRAGQDGSDRKLLTESPFVVHELFTLPRNTLTLDMADKRVYWLDMHQPEPSQCSIMSVRYDGTDRRVLHTFPVQNPEVFNIDLFGDHIYWTDGENKTILRISKHKDREGSATPVPTLVLQSGVIVDTFRIVHSSRQPNVTNKCVGHTCSQSGAICLPLATGSPGYTCGCPEAQMWTGSACISAPPTVDLGTQSDRQNPVLDNDTKLLFTINSGGIYMLPNMTDIHTNHIQPNHLYLKSDSIRKFDYNYHKNLMVWLEINGTNDRKVVYGAPLDRTKPSMFETPMVIFEYNYISVPDLQSLAIDWIHDLLYISVPKGIVAVSIGQKDQYYSYDVIKHNDIQADVSVDPIHGLLVWSQIRYNMFLDSEQSGRIMRANQDGSDVFVLSKATKTPATIALDIDAQVVYWIDMTVHALYSVNYTGLDFTTVFVSEKYFEMSVAMDVFGDQLYWSDGESKAVYVINKSGQLGVGALTLVNAVTDVEDIKVLDSRRQMNSTNRCSNSRCAHMCLPVQRDYRCVCDKNANQFTPICGDKHRTISRPLIWNSGMATTADITPEVIMSRNAIPNQLIVHDHHYTLNLSHKVDSLVNITQLIPEPNGTHFAHWIAIALISMAVNLVLIAIFIYRKRPKSGKNFVAIFRKDRETLVNTPLELTTGYNQFNGF